ncbi:MAG TPA: hypothetical protein VN598_03830 [Usitatibacter sp.]|nr:hypothetical protein [Usitatibacter sp.]
MTMKFLASLALAAALFVPACTAAAMFEAHKCKRPTSVEVGRFM